MHQHQQEHDQRRLEHDNRGTVSSVLNRDLLSLGKKSDHHKHGDSTDDHSSGSDTGNNANPKVVALAGDNNRAIMHAAGLEDAEAAHGLLFGGGSNERLWALANSNNYQAANNSIMIGGSCNAEDPAIHIVIEDFGDDDEEDDDDNHMHGRKENKKKKDFSDKEEQDHETEKDTDSE